MSDEQENWPFTIQHDPKYGHFMVKIIMSSICSALSSVFIVKVATRDIKPMELILRELPVVVGPYTRTDPGLHCVECFKRVRNRECVSDEVSGYPLCTDKCKDGPNHKVKIETC